MQLELRRAVQSIAGRRTSVVQVLRDGEVVATCGSSAAALEVMDRLWDARPQADRVLEQLYNGR